MHLNSAAIVFLVIPLCTVLAVRPQYQHFEDYLNHLDDNDQSWIADSGDEDKDDDSKKDGQDEASSTTTTSTTTTTTTTMTPYIQEPSAKNLDVTCCMLGQLAGDKGYHCYTQYYAARIVMRNRNRAHNRKMAFYGLQRIRNYGEKVMRTFEQCVASRGTVFHKCCHLASMERRVDRYDTVQRAKFQRRRHQHQDVVDDDEDDDDNESDDKTA